MGVMENGKRMLDQVFALYHRDGRPYSDLRMFEFGNQWTTADFGVSSMPMKQYMAELGLKEHVSLDLNGRDGALKRDMAEDVTDLGEFDIVTNFGSSEHVEPFEHQYHVFRNLHCLCRPGGFMIHHVPLRGQWAAHCPVYYTRDFFWKLADRHDYRLLNYSDCDQHNLASLIYQRCSDVPFVPENLFPLSLLVWDNSTDYPKFEGVHY